MENYGDWDTFVRDMYGSREEMYGTAEEDMMPEPMYYESGLEAGAREEARMIAAWDDVDPNDLPCAWCGVARSEHALCGCPDGYQTQEQRKAESDHYSQMARNDDDAYESEPTEYLF